MDKISKRDISLGLLISANCTKALEPLNIIPSCDNGPYAFQTRLGWCIVGPVNRGNRKGISCSCISVKMADTNDTGRHHFQVKTGVRETGIKEILDKIYNEEFAEVSFPGSKKKEISQQDMKFMEILDEGTKLQDGHYQIPLTFKQEDVRLPCNKYQAAQRLSYLKRKFDKNEKFKADYIRFMEEITVKGYARKSTMTAAPGKMWYLPHHGVYHPNKPGKIRVVFDLSAEHKGTCLNKELLPGPDLTNQIIGVLLRFREEHVGVMGDIEAIFHQVKVPDTLCSFLKFLWWEVSDTSKEIIDYEMTAHVFGGSSSPSCSNYALRKTAMDNEELYGKDVATILEKNFYVNDMLKSFPTAEEAITVIQQVKDICYNGGFNLTKFISNNTAVLKSIPDDSQRAAIKDGELALGCLPEDKALGVKWNTEKDTLGFTIKFMEKPSTRRGLLSMLSSIYDPLGLGAPFMLKGRQIIQQLCQEKLQWDEQIDERSAYEWLRWKNNLLTLENVTVPRCHKSKDFGKNITYSLHHFSDASESGYGQASYLRMKNENGDIRCCLIFGKSRVAPVKYVSIPRLELTAATLSVKISMMLKEELDIHITSESFWTDSQVVLGYINNESQRFKVFVANRAQFI